MFPEELKTRLRNVHAYAVTPFKKDDLLSLDLHGFTRNIQFMIDRGIQVITVGGGTGEVDSLAVDELEILVQTALQVASDQVLIIPTLPENLAVAAALAPRYQKMGARVALGMAPFMRNQIPEDLEGVFNYYKRLGQCSDLALLPYNTQAWTPEFFERLAEIDQIIGVKDPCQVPHNLFRAIKRLGDRFVWIGNKRHDPGVLHFRFQAGIEAFTAGFINFIPRFELDLFGAATRRDWDHMVEIQEQLAPLERLRNKYSEGLLKTGLDLVGLAGGPVRPPRTDASPEGREALAQELKRLGVDQVIV
jgi:dihydrodipicolinate synthase/N-acetylneuraminate lyase